MFFKKKTSENHAREPADEVTPIFITEVTADALMPPENLLSLQALTPVNYSLHVHATVELSKAQLESVVTDRRPHDKRQKKTPANNLSFTLLTLVQSAVLASPGETMLTLNLGDS